MALSEQRSHAPPHHHPLAPCHRRDAQTAEVLQRPYCVLEINAAVKARVPIVALNCRGKGYDFAKSVQYMRHLDTELETVNPGAPALLI